MNPIPDIVVLDFCEWLNQQLKNNHTEEKTVLDILIGNGNNQYRLEEYANEFLESKKTKNCCFKDVMMLFFQSQEFYKALQKCHLQGHRFKKRCDYFFDLHGCMNCPLIYSAIHTFIKGNDMLNSALFYNDISADHLAEYTRYLVLYGNSNNRLFNESPLLELMVNTNTEISEELNFLNWLENHINRATDVRKMPADVFERFIDQYIYENQKTNADKEKLLKSYHFTGWEELLEKFQVLLRIKNRKSKNLSEVIDRYYSHYGRIKCVILPLSDPKSQRIYRALINESWEDLNSCSGDYLDIYYSEVDTGKSGFDIAQRINSLPKSLKNKAPCIIIWEHSISDADYLPIRGLDNIQIVELIRSMVENIQSNMDFKGIIKEAKNKVEELHDEKKTISNNYNLTIKGEKINVDGSIAVGEDITIGSSNAFNENTNLFNSEAICKTVEEFKKASIAIKDSKELDEEMKSRLLEIMEMAQIGISERSNEKQIQAKKDFASVKSFLINVAPTLIGVLANFATIANFFGLTF